MARITVAAAQDSTAHGDLGGTANMRGMVKRRGNGVYLKFKSTGRAARHGVPPLSARHLQEAIVGSTLMYGSEVVWRGQRSMCQAFQRSINRMTRATLGVPPSTPVAFLQAEGGSIPAEARLDGRQEAFAVRLASREGQQGRLLQAGTGLGSRLRSAVGTENIEEVEQVGCGRGLVFPGVVAVPKEGRGSEEKEELARQAMTEANIRNRDLNTIWTDGSRLEDGRVGAGMAWYEKGDRDEEGNIEIRRRDNRTAGQRKEGKQETYLGRHRSIRRARDGWRSGGFRLGGGHEAYDAEVAAIV